MERDATMRTANDIMRTDLVTLSPETSLADAVTLLLNYGISGAPVVDPDDHLLGVLSEKDCLRFLASSAFYATPSGTVADVMQRDVATTGPEADVFRLAFEFHDHPCRRLPVVAEDGTLLGLVARRDVMRALDEIRRQRESVPHPSTYEVLEAHRGF